MLWHCSLAAVIGIDYGQQYIKAMVVSPRAPLELVLTPEAKRKDVSGLAIRKQGDGIERVYGSAVGSLATRFPKNSLLHLKPLLGKTEGDESDILLYLKEHPGVNITTTRGNSLAISVDGQQYPIEELGAMNIQEIVNRANSFMKEKDSSSSDHVDKLAITVPDFFDERQRRAMLDVGSLTTDNLETCLISDGLSVLLNFAFKQRDFVPGEPQYYIVYDMGAGSTRASLFSILQPTIETEPLKIEFGGYGFDKHLGGSKFTLDVAGLIENKFLESHKNIRTDVLHSNPNAVAKINQAAEKAKLILSANNEASVSIESLIGDIDFRTKITRQDFEDFIQESVVDLIKPIEDALDEQLWESPIALKDVQGIILTGGSSRVPIVQQRLCHALGENKILKSVNADESAVNGATIRAVKLFNAFKTKAVDIVERSTSAFSLRAMSDEVEMNVFPKGKIFPSTETIEIKDRIDSSEAFTMDFFENGKILRTVTVSPESLKKAFVSDECSDGVSFNLTMSLSRDRLFELDKIQALCWNEPTIDAETESTDATKNSSANDGENIREVSSRRFKSSRVDFTVKEASSSHLSHQEKYRLREHIRALNERDYENFEFERAKNELEALLYETREFISSEDIATSGPKRHLDKLAEIIPAYLSWLEDESDGALKIDVTSKIAEINDLKGKIELYVESLSEPLDVKQFEGLLEKADKITKQLTVERERLHEGLSALNETFSQAGYDAQKEYSKINLPYYLSNPLKTWEEKLEALEELAKVVQEKLSSNSLNDESREQLFESKLAFDKACIELEQTIELFEKARNYRFRELLSWFQRAEKAKRRKELKSKSLEMLKSSSTSVTPTPEVTSDSFTTTSLMSTSTSSSIIPTDDSGATKEAPFHDEL